MKKLYLFCLVILNANFLLAQITIADNSNKEEERIYSKPIPFDSSSNWIDFNNLYENKQYIGLKVFLPKTSDNEISGNRYCIITDVLYGDKIEKFWLDFEKKCDSCPASLDNEDYSKLNADAKNIKLIFQLKDEKTNELLYLTYVKLRKNILVQYFENQQQKFKNKVLIYDDLKIQEKNSYANYINCNRLLNDIKKVVTFENELKEMETVPKEVVLKRGSKWTCIDVTLIKDTEIYSRNLLKGNSRHYNPEKFNYRMFYILKNDLEETIALESLNPLVGEEKQSRNFHDPKCFYSDYSIEPRRYTAPNENSEEIELSELKNSPFILESSYIIRERQQKIATQASIVKQKQEENNRNLKEKNDFIKKQSDLITKYGAKYGTLISQNKISIGMNMEMCKLSWGSPYSNNKQITAEKTIEIWHYIVGSKLYFNNDKLVQIEQ